jgi:hypothetical protein
MCEKQQIADSDGIVVGMLGPPLSMRETFKNSDFNVQRV